MRLLRALVDGDRVDLALWRTLVTGGLPAGRCRCGQWAMPAPAELDTRRRRWWIELHCPCGATAARAVPYPSSDRHRSTTAGGDTGTHATPTAHRAGPAPRAMGPAAR